MKELTVLNNEVLGEDTGRQAPGMICLANEERFTAAHFSEGLTAYAVGWKDPENIEATLDLVAPRVDVPRRFEFKEALNSEAFLSESDDIRAIGAPFKLVQYRGKSNNEKTHNKGLTFRLDKDEDNLPGQEERATGMLISRLRRNDFRRAGALLIAAATNTAKTWDTTYKKDPDMDVIEDLITGGDARGIQSDTVVYGENAWQKRGLAHRAQNTAGGFASAALTPAQLAQLLMVDRVVISKERYQSSASAKSKVIGSYVIMYMAPRSVSRDDPSNIKRFVTPVGEGGIRVYRQEHAKYVDISVEHYSNIVITSTLGIRMFTVS